MMKNKKDYSLLLIKTVERLFTKIRKFVEDNGDILELTTNNQFNLLVEDKSESSNFQFSISNPKQDTGNKVLFIAEFNPSNGVQVSTRTIVAEEELISSNLVQWANIIRQYNRVCLTPEETILSEYEREFYDSFELIDEDADTHSYELGKQIMINNYFTDVIKILQNNEKENIELIEEAQEIKENITRMTKKVTIKKISAFFAKVRKKSLPLLKELLDVGKKEFFRKAITAGFEMIGELTTLIL